MWTHSLEKFIHMCELVSLVHCSKSDTVLFQKTFCLIFLQFNGMWGAKRFITSNCVTTDLFKTKLHN